MYYRIFLRKCYPYLALSLGFTLIFLFISVYKFNWPYIDDFNIAKWYDELYISKTNTVFNMLFFTRNGPHFVGLFSVISAAIFHFYGIDYTKIVLCSLFCLFLSSILIYFTVRKSFEGRLNLALPIIIVLLIFQPTQIKHILWAFELSWFLVTLFLFLNLYLVERSGKWIVLTPFFALLACFCSFQGFFLLPTLALHLALKKTAPYRLALIILSLAVFVIMIAASLRSSADSTHVSLQQAPAIAMYTISVIGGTFGLRDPTASFLLGLGILACAATLCVSVARKVFDLSVVDRVALVLVGASLLMIAAFSLGRFQYGLPWALFSFHAAPLLIPMLLGIALWSMNQTMVSGSAIMVLPAVYVLASWVVAVPYAVKFAASFRDRQQVALVITCTPTTSLEYATRVNIGSLDFISLVESTLPILKPLCAQPLPERVVRMATFPELYNQIIAKNPDARGPLEALWQLYFTRADLVEAFQVESPTRAKDLLNWAISASRTETLFGGDQRPYQSYFEHRSPLD
ncbi:hypothetical protein [Roseixanthobacter pseudopolyaromaticivorans]|uniref:hypothetical protein n=1 Tax=Xanthobacteraceae TaxID=335928 RepID=UPI00372C74E7